MILIQLPFQNDAFKNLTINKRSISTVAYEATTKKSQK